MRPGFAVVLLLALAVGGCATHATAPAVAASQAALPDGARPDLDKHWVKPDGGYDWPPNEGFNGQPVALILPPGMLLDRFGGDGGNFLSPRARRSPSAPCRQSAKT